MCYKTGQIGHRVDNKRHQLRWGAGWRVGRLRKEIAKKSMLKLK